MLGRCLKTMTRTSAVSFASPTSGSAFIPLNFFHSKSDTDSISLRFHEIDDLVYRFFKSVSPSSNRDLTLNRSLSLFDSLLKSHSSSDSILPFTQLLTVLSRISCHSHAISLSRRFDLSSRIAPDIFSLSISINTLINGFCSQGLISEALFLFRKMDGFAQPNVITYNTLVKGLCNVGNLDTALQLLLKMEQHSTCKPSIVTYNTIIDNLSKVGQLSQALDFFSKMISLGISPDIITYNSLIKGASHVCQWNQVMRLLTEVKGTNISPDVQTYNVLVDAFCKQGIAYNPDWTRH